MGLAWMIIVLLFFCFCVYVYMCASSVILRIAFPQVLDFRQRTLTGLLMQLKQWNSNKHKRFVSRKVFWILLWNYWVCCTFVELKFEKFISKKTQIMKKNLQNWVLVFSTQIMFN